MGDKKDRWQVDLTRAGELQEGYDKAGGNGSKKVMVRTALLANNPMNPFFQEIGKLKLHPGRLTSLDLDIVKEAVDSKDKNHHKGDKVDDF